MTHFAEPLTHALFAKNIHFVAGVAHLEQLPDLNLPEVAFIGRSNVGKSSLLNALVGQKHLARTSGTPGATRLACGIATAWPRRSSRRTSPRAISRSPDGMGLSGAFSGVCNRTRTASPRRGR